MEMLAVCQILWTNRMYRAENVDLGFLPGKLLSKDFSKAFPNHCLSTYSNDTSHTLLSLKLIFSKHSALLNNTN
jgi:hypothetical protein